MEIASKFVLFHERFGETTLSYDKNGNLNYCNYPVIDYLKQFCLYKAATYQGRKSAMLTLTNYRQKLPIYIGKDIFYFPIFGSKASENYWVCYNFITEVKNRDGASEIHFTGDFKYLIPTNKRIIIRQMKRCENYLLLLKEMNLVI